MPGPCPSVRRPTAEELAQLEASPKVKIYVGDREEPFIVPRDKLGWFSPYFSAFFRPGAFKEGVEGVLEAW